MKQGMCYGIVIIHHMESTTIRREQQLRYCNQDFIGLLFLNMLMNIVESVIDVKRVVQSQKEMNYPCNIC